jgi:hypothetical protein
MPKDFTPSKKDFQHNQQSGKYALANTKNNRPPWLLDVVAVVETHPYLGST